MNDYLTPQMGCEFKKTFSIHIQVTQSIMNLQHLGERKRVRHIQAQGMQRLLLGHLPTKVCDMK